MNKCANGWKKAKIKFGGYCASFPLNKILKKGDTFTLQYRATYNLETNQILSFCYKIEDD